MIYWVIVWIFNHASQSNGVYLLGQSLFSMIKFFLNCNQQYFYLKVNFVDLYKKRC